MPKTHSTSTADGRSPLLVRPNVSEPVLEPDEALGDRNGPRAWIEYAAARFGLGAVAAMPYAARELLIGGVARLACIFDRRHSEAARMYMRQALGCELIEREGDARVLQAWRHLFRVALDSVAFTRRVPAERLLEHFEVEACPEFYAAVEAGRGGLFAGPHVGDWEAGSAFVVGLGCAPLYAFARPPRNRPLSAHLLRTRRERGIHVLPRKGGMERVRALARSGAWIALLPDQRPRKRSISAPFFGRPAPCERGVGVLAQRLQVPIAFGACYLTERPFQYRLVIPRIVHPAELEGRSLEAITTLVNEEMERLILARPEQYHWLHDRYRGAPTGGAGEGKSSPELPGAL